MTIYRWDPALAPRGVSFNLRGMSIGGPPTLTGRNQVGQLDAGYWTASYTKIPVGPSAVVQAFRALRAKMEGGAHQILVPVFDDAQVPYALAGGKIVNANPEQPYSDGTLHTDGHGFYLPAIIVSTSADAALRATSISATVTTAGTISAGTYFSIGDRLYLIKEVLSSSGGARTWSISPPLREAVPSGTPINFEAPICRMRLLSESEMDLVLERGLYGFSDINFIEAL